MRLRTWILLGIGLVAVGGAVAYSQIETALEVDMEPVARRTLDETITEEGRTRVPRRYTVTAPVSGQLLGITAREGDTVDEGALLGRVFPPPQHPRELKMAEAEADVAAARVAEAEARLDEAILAAEQAVSKAERSQRLAEIASISEVVAEQDRMAAESASRQVEVARAGLSAARAGFDAAEAAVRAADPDNAAGEALDITAPAGGRVLRIHERNDRVVGAGTPIMEIGDTSSLEIVIDVLSDDAVRVEPGDTVLIDRWGGSEILEATVTLIEPDAFSEVSALGVSEQRVNVIALLDGVPDRLGVGYRVEAGIVTWTGADVLAVPTSALFRADGEWHVFAVSEGRAAERAITIGHRTGEYAEVLDGLSEGEPVILFPSDGIADGTAVE